MSINIYRKIFSCLLVLSLCISSCKKDEERPGEQISEDPEVSFKAIQENEKLKGDIEIELLATDQSGIAKVEVYINNTLFTTLTEPPYVIKWKTRDYADGTYTIKAIAYDNKGRTKEITLTVKVQNRLLKVNVPEDALVARNKSYTLNGWVFVSDSKGKTLGAKKFKNGDTLEFQSPDDFNEEKIYLSILEKAETTSFSLASYIETYIQTYTFNAGEEITLGHSMDISEISVGTSNLTVTNTPEINHDDFDPILSFEGEKGYISSLDWYDDKIDMNVRFYQSPANALLSIRVNEEEAPRYKFLNGLEKGKNYTANYAELPSMSGHFELELPEVEYSHLELFGYKTDVNWASRYNLGFSSDKQVKIYYPEEFQKFESFLYIEDQNRAFMYHKIGSLISTFNPLEINFGITSSNVNNFSFTSSGLYDLYSIRFYNSHSDSQTEYFFSWDLLGMKGAEVSGFIPELPAEIAEENTHLKRDQLSLNTLAFIKFSDLNSEEIYNSLKGHLGYSNQTANVVFYFLSQDNERRSLHKNAAPHFNNTRNYIRTPYAKYFQRK